jgi:hypothetical protein
MNWRKLASLTFAVMLVLSLLPTVGLAQDTKDMPQLSDKVDKELADLLSVNGSADFIATMAEQADLSPAYEIGDWNARGQYVYDVLRAVAERSQANAKDYLDKLGLRYQTFIAGNELYVFGGNLDTTEALATLPEVSYIRATRVYQIPEPIPGDVAPANTPQATTDWGITDTKADLFWSQFGYEGDGIVVSNIDTGVDYTHVALNANYKCQANPSNPECWLDPGAQSCTGPGGGPCDTIYSGIYHGSHTMGTMAADNDPSLTWIAGMAPNAKWIACLGCPSGSCPDLDLNTCADWVVAPNGNPNARPHIVNNSWGGGGGDPWYLAKVNAWRAAGVFPAFSAGNSYSCNTLGSPGDYQESFGSASHQVSRTISDFSSKGPSTYGHDPYTKPNISSPGEDIWSTQPGNGWTSISGTSMASPHTAGAVALLWSCNPSLVGNIDQTFQILQSMSDTPPTGSCSAPPDGQGNYTYGYGYLDILAAGEQYCVSDWGAINGHVYNAVTNAPIDGVAVTGYRDAGGSWADDTDATGYYSMTVGVGTYTVEAVHPQYATGSVSGLDVATGTVVTQDFYLQPRGHLYGYVTDQDSGAPLAATVSVASGPSTATNPANGYYEFYLDAGTYDVTASAPDYADESASISLTAGEQEQHDFTLLAAIAVVPDPIAITLEMGQTGTVASQMTNNMAVPYPFEFIEIEGVVGTQGSGGPDPFGYTYVDSNEAGGARYEWIDATDGTALGLADDGELGVTLPFPFTFYGTSSTNICIGNNGGFIFNATTCDLSTLNADLGTTTASNLIVPFWDDIDSDTGDVYYKTVGTAPDRLFIIEWYNRPHYSNIGSGTFELILYEGTNNVKYQYLDTNFGNALYDYGISATSGIRQTGTNYLQYSYNQAVLVDGLAICFNYPGSPPCDGGDVTWFGTSITQGTVPANSTVGWTDAFSATTAAGIGQPGVYNARLRIVPTTAGLPSKQVPVVMTVLPSSNFGRLEGTVTSDRPGGPLEADILIEATDGTTVALTTDPATGYYSYWLEQGSYDVTASAPDYVPETATVQVTGLATTAQDFELALNEPEIVVTPPELVETLQFGQTGVQVLNIANDGLQPLTWEIREANAGQIQANDILLMGDDLLAASWTVYRDSLTAAGVSWDEWNLDTQPFPTAVQLAPYSLLIWADEDTLTPDNAECQIVADWLNSGGKSLFATGIDFMWDIANGTPGSGENNLYVLFNTTYTGDYAGTGITALNGVAGDPIGGDFVAPNGLTLAGTGDSNGDYANTASVATTGLIYGTGGTGSGYAGLTHYEGASYKIVWLGVNFHNGLTVQAQRDTLMANILGFLGGAGDVLWLGESPTSGTVLPGESANVDVTFDSTQVPEPSVYHAMLRVLSDDPLNGRVEVPVTMNVLPSGDIGRLDGMVTSDRPGGPLAADVLIESTYGMSWTVPTAPATGYYYKWLIAGTYTVTASADGYIPQTAEVLVTGLQTTTQDFELVLLAPEIAVDPASMHQTLTMGGTAVQTLNISNLGNLPLTFEIVERNGDFFPARAGEDILVVRKDTTAATAMETALTALGYTFLGVTDTEFQAMTVDELLNYQAVFYAGTTGYSGTPTASENLLVAYLDAGGSLFISDNDLGYYRNGSTFYDTYLQSTYILDNGGDYLDGLDLMAGLTLDVTADPYPDGITVGAEGTSIFQFQGSANQGGVALDRNSYRAIYTAFDYQNIADPAQEVEVINRVLGFIAVSDAPWLSEDPITGTVAAGETAPVEVTFDAGVVADPGDYTAMLRIKHNDPLAQPVNVPVTMTVLPGIELGRLEGTVTGTGYCDEESYPLEASVLIEAEDGSSWAVVSDPATGYYYRWLDSGTYTVTASAPEHLDSMAVVQITGQQTTTQDLALRYIESCMDVTPTSFSLTLPVDTQLTELLTIGNSGAGELAWELRETTATMRLLNQDVVVSVPAIDARADVASRTGVKAFPARQFTMHVGGVSAEPIDVLIVTPDVVGGGDITLLLNTLAAFPDLVVTIWDGNAGTPTVADMQAHDVVFVGNDILWTSSTIDKTVLSNTLADYIDAGGKVLAGSFLWSYDAWGLGGGRFLTEDYSPFEMATVDFFQPATLGDYDAGHPLMAGITSITDNFNHQDTALSPNGMWVASWDDDWTLAAVSPNCVGLNQEYFGNADFGGQTGELLHNALLYLAGGGQAWTDIPWVTEVPTNGVVPPDSFFDVDVTFDTTGLTAGECYTGSLGLLHDDPGWDNPLFIPLTLCVSEACEEVTGVDLSVVTPGPFYPGANVEFSADIVPDGFTGPYNYSINGGPVQVAGDDPLLFSLTFTEPGTFAVEIAVWNCDMTTPATATVEVVVTSYTIYLPVIFRNYP